MRRNEAIILALPLLALLLSASLYGQLPERMATHFDIHGQPDGYMDSAWGAFLVPVMMAALALLLSAVPLIDPLRRNIEAFRGDYERMVMAVLLLLLLTHVQGTLWNIGIRISMALTIPIGIGLLFIVIGSMLSRTRRNWFIGIRTPWTMSSDIVWKRTHELGGSLFVASGVLAMGAVFVPALWPYLVVGPVLVSSLALIVYSYLEFRKLERYALEGKMEPAPPAREDRPKAEPKSKRKTKRRR